MKLLTVNDDEDENMNFVCCVRDSRREEPIDEEEQVELNAN